MASCWHDSKRFEKTERRNRIEGSNRPPQRPGREKQRQEISLLDNIGAKYRYMPLKLDAERSDEDELSQGFTHMGEVYLYRLRHPEYGRLLVAALEIMAEPANYPLVFHCMAGKDRTGVLAAVALSILGVSDEDIIDDYTLSAPYIKALYSRMKNDPTTREDILNLPVFHLEPRRSQMGMVPSGHQAGVRLMSRVFKKARSFRLAFREIGKGFINLIHSGFIQLI